MKTFLVQDKTLTDPTITELNPEEKQEKLVTSMEVTKAEDFFGKNLKPVLGKRPPIFKL